MSDLPERPSGELLERTAAIAEAARGHSAGSANTALVQARRHIGREIAEVEQHPQEHARHGEEVGEQLSTRRTRRLGKGFNFTSLKRTRQFYRAFPNGPASLIELGDPEKGAG